MKLPLLKAELQSDAVLIGAAVVGVAVLAFVLSRYGSQIGKAVGAGAGNLAGGAVIGLGSTVGLPDTSDPVTVAAGRNALDRGDYVEASLKLPASEFLGGIGSKFGLWLAGVTHPVSPQAGGSVVFGGPAAPRGSTILFSDWS